jgi:hypothetical protein
MKYVVGFSGGVTSAKCADIALTYFPKDDVILLFHDTKEEHPDTYRYIKEMSEKLNHSITECSDGRSVSQVCRDEEAIANDRMAFCSRILKAEQKEKFIQELLMKGEHVTLILGFDWTEWKRIQRAYMNSLKTGYHVLFPLANAKITKDDCFQWSKSIGVEPSRMYEWSGHANCIGCHRGSKNYWLAVRKHEPEIFEQKARLEREIGHSILSNQFLDELKGTCNRSEITIGACECGE